MKILLLDDEEAVLTSLSRMLMMLDHETDTFTKAADAVKAIEVGEYSVALVDYKMPENNGIWFMQNANIPKSTRVLLMTAYVNRDVIVEMFRLGACGYLIKPFDENELKMHLSFHCGGHAV